MKYRPEGSITTPAGGTSPRHLRCLASVAGAKAADYIAGPVLAHGHHGRDAPRATPSSTARRRGDGTHTRKPRLLFRLSRVFLFRHAPRAFCMGLFQDPPRILRAAPPSAFASGRHEQRRLLPWLGQYSVFPISVDRPASPTEFRVQNSDWGDGTHTRKPRRLSRMSRGSLYRHAPRAFRMGLNLVPPRITRRDQSDLSVVLWLVVQGD